MEKVEQKGRFSVSEWYQYFHEVGVAGLQASRKKEVKVIEDFELLLVSVQTIQ